MLCDERDTSSARSRSGFPLKISASSDSVQLLTGNTVITSAVEGSNGKRHIGRCTWLYLKHILLLKVFHTGIDKLPDAPRLVFVFRKHQMQRHGWVLPVIKHRH